VLYSSVTERTGEVTLGTGEPITLAPPLAGDRWLAANGCCAASPHRRAVLPIDGRFAPFERFAIDWLRVDPDLDPASLPEPGMLPSISGSADATTNDAYLAYDEPLLAVADGTVVKVVDGRAEQAPHTDPQGLQLDEFGGNYLLLDIGDGFHAFYAHLKGGPSRSSRAIRSSGARSSAASAIRATPRNHICTSTSAAKRRRSPRRTGRTNSPPST
jgi:hypothetical protein